MHQDECSILQELYYHLSIIFLNNKVEYDFFAPIQISLNNGILRLLEDQLLPMKNHRFHQFDRWGLSLILMLSLQNFFIYFDLIESNLIVYIFDFHQYLVH